MSLAVAKNNGNNNTASVHICKKRGCTVNPAVNSRNIHNLSLSEAVKEQPNSHNQYDWYNDTQKTDRYSLLKLPLPVVQWTHLSGFQPARDTVEMESMLRKRKTEQVQLILTRHDSDIKHTHTHTQVLATKEG